MDGQTITTLNGDLTVNIDAGGAVTLTDGAGNDVNVIATDIRTLTGVVHLIDGVLMPE
ncbi:MAG: fasciclin domain-containing protein [Myxococcota bacterium]